MAFETYSNNAKSSLLSGITSGATSLTLASGGGAAFPSSGNFRIIIDAEIILVGVRSTDTLSSLTRGIEGTTAAAHSAGAPVAHVMTAGSLDQIRLELSNSGVDASKAANKAGNLYFPTDGVQIYRDTGAAMNPWGPLYPFTPIVDGDFTDLNAPTKSTASGVVTLSTAASATINIRGRKKAAPSTPYTITTAFVLRALLQAYHAAGLFVRDSATGKLVVWMVLTNTNAGQGKLNIISQDYTNETTFLADNVMKDFHMLGPIVFLRYTDDGTNRKLSYSFDNLDFEEVLSEARTTFITANEVGFMVYINDNTAPTRANFYHWLQT